MIFDAKVKGRSCCKRQVKAPSLAHKAVAFGEELDATAELTKDVGSITNPQETGDEEYGEEREVDKENGASPSSIARGYLWLLQKNIVFPLCGSHCTLYYIALLLAVSSVVAAGFLCTYATYLSTPTGPGESSLSLNVARSNFQRTYGTDETLQTRHMFYSFGTDFRAVTNVGSAIDFSVRPSQSFRFYTAKRPYSS